MRLFSKSRRVSKRFIKKKIEILLILRDLDPPYLGLLAKIGKVCKFCYTILEIYYTTFELVYLSYHFGNALLSGKI